MQLIRHHPMSRNDLRQCLRIATGGTLGFMISKVMGFNYAVFFTVTPMLLLGLVPIISAAITRQVIASSVLSIVEVGVLAGLFGGQPMMMTAIAFVLFLYRFACMSKGSLFLFGANGVISLSIMLHFASYPDTNVNDLIFCNFWGHISSIGIAFLMMAIFPDVAPRTALSGGNKAPHRMRHEALLGATVATISFCVFQVLDLRDSLSAQATTLILLFPMHWNGALGYARRRALGTIIGVSCGLLIQLLLYNWSHELLLLLPLFWLFTLLFSQAHITEAIGSGVGFAGMTTLGILYGQNLTPNNDLIFSGLYRTSSILIAIVATLIVCYVVHSILNRFEATRFGH
ncbi:DUF2955 domain-containing protein [Shewanella psychrotolerans]|uniref:DUF2955 domain-containing protein n=1 Tax=Shewanella psychrotolerans TaxID=2864206 RepID=UPI001C65C582|nr:DUF2955 domain-containing protein [Shewanella psychrotolerans]QYK02999.1 DUF2955 domain-containing protein [Shewanella psychrotolerans]